MPWLVLQFSLYPCYIFIFSRFLLFSVLFICFQVAETHLLIYQCLQSSTFQEKKSYALTSLLILQNILTPNNFFYPENFITKCDSKRSEKHFIIPTKIWILLRKSYNKETPSIDIFGHIWTYCHIEISGHIVLP